MSVKDLFTEDLWVSVAHDLRGVAKAWWSENEDYIVGMAKEEAEDIFRALKRGDTLEAKQALVARMTPDEWRAYRDGTTGQLQAIARRRAELYGALEDLGRRAARVIGDAVLSAMGVP